MCGVRGPPALENVCWIKEFATPKSCSKEKQNIAPLSAQGRTWC